jgi:hypothetical protein
MSFRSDYGGQIKKINTQLTNSVHFGEPQASPVEIVNYSIPDRVTTLENYIVDVKKHGAKGDGVTDDTAAIQYCLDTYGVAYLSAGTYMVSGIVVDTQQKLYGAGQEQSILKALPTCTTAVVTCRNAAYAIVRDFSIYGGAAVPVPEPS